MRRAAPGEIAHLAGDDGEAAALITGARRLDHSAEGEEVGLERDVVDDGDDLGELLIGFIVPSPCVLP